MKNMNNKFFAKMTVRLYEGETKCFGPGIARLLHRVEELHSLRSAALSMDMAYSKAWSIIRQAESSLGFSLLNRTVGGRNGGGANLTEEAAELLRTYDAYCREVETYAAALFEEKFSFLQQEKTTE